MYCHNSTEVLQGVEISCEPWDQLIARWGCICICVYTNLETFVFCQQTNQYSTISCDLFEWHTWLYRSICDLKKQSNATHSCSCIIVRRWSSDKARTKPKKVFLFIELVRRDCDLN